MKFTAVVTVAAAPLVTGCSWRGAIGTGRRRVNRIGGSDNQSSGDADQGKGSGNE